MGVDDAARQAAFGRTVPAVPENVAAIRHAIVGLARSSGAGEEILADLALAVGEACSNVVTHAYPPGDTGPLIVHAAVDGADEIVVSITDQGQGLAPRADSPGLGLGLPLIANLAARLEMRDGPGGVGAELVMAFALERRTTPPA